MYLWFNKDREQTQAFQSSTQVPPQEAPAVARLLHNNLENSVTAEGEADYKQGDGKTKHKKITYLVIPWAAARVVPQVCMSSPLSSHTRARQRSCPTTFPCRALLDSHTMPLPGCNTEMAVGLNGHCSPPSWRRKLELICLLLLCLLPALRNDL